MIWICKVIPILLIITISFSVIANSNINEILDQSQTNMSCGYYNTFTAQSFRPKLNFISKVEIGLFKQINASGTVKLSIRKHLYGHDLTSKIVSIDEIPYEYEYNWVEFDFEDIEINPNRIYYIVFTQNNGTRVNGNDDWVSWLVGLHNPYSSGNPYHFYKYLWIPLWLTTPYYADFSFITYGYNQDFQNKL